ncbi:hypothetical protein BDA96_05G184300 [Sorghum bicolor]|uniref:Uncharacterized protein n=1 Tax=Sorghum bicolor TaxID=4558 RepID=A0A921QXZ8_SORBI|nr:hypothetical protein BDA96_05G184300 [Sorghum bicolor]
MACYYMCTVVLDDGVGDESDHQSAGDELVVDVEVSHLVSLPVGVDLLEHRLVVEVEAAIAALVHDPRRDGRPRRAVRHPDALAAGGLPLLPRGPAEGRPAVLLPPRQRLAGVPGGAVGADGVEVPVVLLRVVVVVRRPHVRRLLRRRHGRHRAQHDGGHHQRRRPSSGDHHRRRHRCPLLLLACMLAPSFSHAGTYDITTA